jgi:hypothetical protein
LRTRTRTGAAAPQFEIEDKVEDEVEDEVDVEVDVEVEEQG